MHVRSIPWVHPRVIELSKSSCVPRAFAVSLEAGCGPEMSAADPECGPGFGGGQFGVRRPLRFLAYKLKLTEPQVTGLAAILDELKTERAQAAVDDRRALTAFAEAVSGDVFDQAKAVEGATLREQSADRLGGAVGKALGRIHALLTPEQRDRFAYLIRTGTVLL